VFHLLVVSKSALIIFICRNNATHMPGFQKATTTILLFVFVFYYWMKSVDSTKIRSYHTKNTIQNDGEEKKNGETKL
jgi:hypothetical protein